MTSVVLLRRALRIVMSEGYPSTMAEFAQKLRKTPNICTQCLRSWLTIWIEQIAMAIPWSRSPNCSKSRALSRQFLAIKNKKACQGSELRHLQRSGEEWRRKSWTPWQRFGTMWERIHVKCALWSSIYWLCPQYTLETSGRRGKSQETKAEPIDLTQDSHEDTGPGPEEELVELRSSSASNKRKQQGGISTPVHKGEGPESRWGSGSAIAAEPSSSPSSGEIRRSHRKRRKISNYKELLDVGIVTDDELWLSHMVNQSCLRYQTAQNVIRWRARRIRLAFLYVLRLYDFIIMYVLLICTASVF